MATFAVFAIATIMSIGLRADAKLSVVAAKTAQQEEPLHPACFDITCADIECLAPLELRRLPDQCCPICWAEDHVISLDRHKALGGENPYLRGLHPAAPGHCAGAKCFAVQCVPGQHRGFVTGSCCESC